jgi:hypothetical protein
MLTGCTLTGADESVDPGELLAKLAPLDLAEVGILWAGPEKEGRPRYPGIRWLREFNAAHEALRGPRPKAALHLCGRAERTVAAWKGGVPSAGHAIGALGFPFRRLYGRVQMNRALGSDLPGRERFHAPRMAAMSETLARSGQRFVAQVKRPGGDVFANCAVSLGPGGHVLIDASGGKGLLPPSWPRLEAWWSPSLSYGYAGGLSPENLFEQIGAIAEARQGNDGFWVDMESSLRDASDGFSVERACEAARECRRWRRGA